MVFEIDIQQQIRAKERESATNQRDLICCQFKASSSVYGGK